MSNTCHFITIITTSYLSEFVTPVCVVTTCFFSFSSYSSFMNFLVSSISDLWNSCLTSRGLTYVSGSVLLQASESTENWEMKVDWTLIIAPNRKSRCGAWTVGHVYPRSASVGAQMAHNLRRLRDVFLVVPRWRVTAGWELRGNQPQVPSTHTDPSLSAWWALKGHWQFLSW